MKKFLSSVKAIQEKYDRAVHGKKEKAYKQFQDAFDELVHSTKVPECFPIPAHRKDVSSVVVGVVIDQKTGEREHFKISRHGSTWMIDADYTIPSKPTENMEAIAKRFAKAWKIFSETCAREELLKYTAPSGAGWLHYEID